MHFTRISSTLAHLSSDNVERLGESSKIVSSENGASPLAHHVEKIFIEFLIQVGTNSEGKYFYACIFGELTSSFS